jgi:hypothetical protein
VKRKGAGAGFYTGHGEGMARGPKRMDDGSWRHGTVNTGDGAETLTFNVTLAVRSRPNEKGFLGATQKAFFENVRFRGRILFIEQESCQDGRMLLK